MKRSERPARPSGKQKAEAKPVVKITTDVINEHVVIAAAIVDVPARKRLLAGIRPDSFLAKGHAELWEALAELDRRGLSYDPATVQQLSGGAVEVAYLEQVVRDRPKLPPNLAHHVESLHWDRARSDSVRGPITALLEALQDPMTEPSRVRALARQVGSSFEGHGGRRFVREPAALSRELVADIRARKDGRSYWPFGLEGLDLYGPHEERKGRRRIIIGAARGKVSVVTGISGGGKSTFAVAVAIAQANMGRRVLYGAWEVDAMPTLESCAAANLGISRTDLAEGIVEEHDIDRIAIEAERLASLIQFVDVPFGRKTGEKQLNDRNLDTIHQLVADSGADFCVFDLWRRAVRQFDPDEEEAALYRQQAIAKETNTHCMLVHQQRLKDIEMRPDKRPTREGLKGSGAWVEVPDLIFGVHRPALFKNVTDSTIEVSILKQRQGPWPLLVEFDFNPETGQFTSGRGVAYEHPTEASEQGGLLGNVRPIDSKRAGRR